MRIALAVLLLASTIGCGRGWLTALYEKRCICRSTAGHGLRQQFHTDAECLRGASFDVRTNAPPIGPPCEYFTTPVTRVTRVSTSRRNNRRWSTCASTSTTSGGRRGAAIRLVVLSILERWRCRHLPPTVGAASGKPVEEGADGAGNRRLPAAPSKPDLFHNAKRATCSGGILAEQPLTERLRSTPVEPTRGWNHGLSYSTLLLSGARSPPPP